MRRPQPVVNSAVAHRRRVGRLMSLPLMGALAWTLQCRRLEPRTVGLYRRSRPRGIIPAPTRRGGSTSSRRDEHPHVADDLERRAAHARHELRLALSDVAGGPQPLNGPRRLIIPRFLPERWRIAPRSMSAALLWPHAAQVKVIAAPPPPTPPEAHVHLAVHRRRGAELLVSLVLLVGAPAGRGTPECVAQLGLALSHSSVRPDCCMRS